MTFDDPASLTLGLYRLHGRAADAMQAGNRMDALPTFAERLPDRFFQSRIK
jgi:hypothetical protein